MTFRIVGNTVRAKGRFFEFLEVEIEDAAGRVHPRDVIRHPGGVGVLPVIDGDVVFVKQYRVALDRPVVEIPAGKLEWDENPAHAAARELAEELGLDGRLEAMGTLAVSPGYTDEIIHLYVATDLTDVARTPHGAEEEAAEIVRVPANEALDMVADGRITDAKTQIALLRWARTVSGTSM